PGTPSRPGPAWPPGRAPAQPPAGAAAGIRRPLPASRPWTADPAPTAPAGRRPGPGRCCGYQWTSRPRFSIRSAADNVTILPIVSSRSCQGRHSQVRFPRAIGRYPRQDRCVELDFERCYRAVDSRDRRFDGWFVTAVTSTGVYCRPSCPAITPKRRNVRFYPSAAAAQRGGFRACRRCRPDAAPGSPEWDSRADVVGRAMRLIGDGVVDREGVPGLAGRLGYTQRHLHRMLTAELGAGPLALARAQRAQTARVLVESTDLGLAEIAFAAGFGSVRQFNDTLREVYGVAPSVLRTARRPAAEPGTLTLRLAYRPP